MIQLAQLPFCKPGHASPSAGSMTPDHLLKLLRRFPPKCSASQSRNVCDAGAGEVVSSLNHAPFFKLAGRPLRSTDKRCGELILAFLLEGEFRNAIGFRPGGALGQQSILFRIEMWNYPR